jgi:hypothetical protein
MIARSLLLVLLCAPVTALCDQLDTAKSAFWKGDFSVAADGYRRAVNAQGRVPDLWFNLGTSEAYAGRYGYSIHAFEQTLALNPDDTGARHNLETVRAAIIDRALKSAKAEKLILPGDDDVGTGLLNQISPQTLHIVFALAWLGLFGLLWLARVVTQPSRRTAATFGALLLGLTAFGSGGLLVSRAYLVDNASVGIVVTDRATAHRGPGTRYPRQAIIASGVKVRLGGADRGWRQATLPNGLGAWIKSADVLPIEPQ